MQPIYATRQNRQDPYMPLKMIAYQYGQTSHLLETLQGVYWPREDEMNRAVADR